MVPSMRNTGHTLVIRLPDMTIRTVHRKLGRMKMKRRLHVADRVR